MKRRMISVLLAAAVVASLLAGCGVKKESTKEEKNEKINLTMWTWFPSGDILNPVIEEYEKEHPNINIELSVMDSQAYQQKLPVALATDEKIDICGVQLSAMIQEIEDYLTPLEGLLDQTMPDWKEKYNNEHVKVLSDKTDGGLKFLTMVNVGSMVGYYNAEVFNELGLKVPTTIDEMKTAVDTIKEKKPEMMPVAFAGKDAWVQDEMMLTVLSQQGDYYNKLRYENASYESPEMIKAFGDYKKFFDLGIFTKDVMDLDYATAADKFISGNAAMYFQGTWDASLLSEDYREKIGAKINNVGAFALPVVDPSGKAAIRSYFEGGLAVTESSEYKEEAAEFVAYLTAGEGMQALGQNFIGIPSKTDFQLNEDLLVTQEEKDGYKLIEDLAINAPADRNNLSAFSDVAGAGVQRVILGETTVEEEIKNLQAEWTSGKYGN